MADSKQSPAVQSYSAEQARQRTAEQSELDRALETTFPASDPISATQTSVANSINGEIATDRDEYPLVEEALRSTGENGGADNRGSIHSLRRNATRLSDDASEIASGAVAVGKAEAKSLIHSVEDMVRESPLAAIGIVAAVAWMWGATR